MSGIQTDDEISPVERWADACEGAIRAVEMVSFEEQGRVAIEQAWELVWLARKLAGIDGEPERFSPSQIGFLRNVGVRVDPHTNGDGTHNQAVFNDRAAKAEKRLQTLRTMLDEANKAWEREQQEDADEGERCFIDSDHVFGLVQNCGGTGWYRCAECARYTRYNGRKEK